MEPVCFYPVCHNGGIKAINPGYEGMKVASPRMYPVCYNGDIQALNYSQRGMKGASQFLSCLPQWGQRGNNCGFLNEQANVQNMHCSIKSGQGKIHLYCCYQGWASFLFKRTFRSCRSFPLFHKERSVLSVLFRSL